MAWGKAGSTTLSSVGDTITISDQTSTKFNTSMYSGSGSGGAVQWRRRYGNSTIDTGSNYADRYSTNGGADSTSTSAASIYAMNSGAGVHNMMHIDYTINISSEEKLTILFVCWAGATGATNAPERNEVVGKWANTSNQYNNLQVVNVNTGDFDSGANLSALGSDITPAAAIPFAANVQVGSRAEITDTRKMYNYVVPSITFEDDFSSDNWTDNDSTNIGVSGGALNWSMFRDMSNDASSRDLTSTSTNWVLRFKVTQGSSIGSTQAGNGFHFGISDSNQSVAQNASQDFVGMSYYYDNQSSYRTIDADGSALPELYLGDSSQNFTITANDVFYFEIIKNGSSYTVEGFTNSDYSTGSLGKITGTTTATGLRYLKIMNDLPNQGAIPTSTNPFDGTIDDVKFYDGFTQTTSFWQEIGA